MNYALDFTKMSIKLTLKTFLATLCLIPITSNYSQADNLELSINKSINDLPKSYDDIINAPEGFYKDELLQTIASQHWQQVEKFLEKSTNHKDAKSLTLKECIDISFANNPEIKQQLSVLESSRDQLSAATRTWNPTASINSESFSITGGESFTESRKETNPSGSDMQSSIQRRRTTDTTNSQANSRVQAEVTWQFLDFTRQPTINSASASYSAQRYAFYVFSRDLVNQIQTNYYQLIAQKDLITSYTIIAQSQRNSAKVQQTRFEAGRVSLQDLGQSYAAYYNTLSRLIQSIQTYYELSSSLARLVSLPDETFIIVEGQNKFQAEWPYDLDKSIALARLNNDRVLQALELSKGSKWSGISQLNSTLPTLYLSANARYQGSDRSTTRVQDAETTRNAVSQNSYEKTSLWSRDSNYDVAALIGFRWNFYQGGVNNANANSEFNRSKSLEFKAEAERDRATDTVRTTINALDSLILEFITAEAAADASKIAYIAALARMNAGLTDITALNQLAQQYQQAVTSEILAVQNYNIRLSNLYRETAIWPQEAEGIADQLLNKTGLD